MTEEMAREQNFRAVVRDGETFLLSTKQQHRATCEPTPEELATQGVCVATAAEWGFRINGALHKSCSAACRAVFTRDGATNQWRGPDHLFILRDGVWRSFNSLKAPVAPTP